jgi:hypothetical protein
VRSICHLRESRRKKEAESEPAQAYTIVVELGAFTGFSRVFTSGPTSPDDDLPHGNTSSGATRQSRRFSTLADGFAVWATTLFRWEARWMVASFNRGYSGFEQTYRICTPAADIVIRRYMEEGAKIARDITAHYAN